MKRNKIFPVIAAMAVIAVMTSMLLTVPTKAQSGKEINSRGNLICAEEGNTVEFYSSDLETLYSSIREFQQEVTDGKHEIVEALHARGVNNCSEQDTFTSLPEQIISVEQKVYIGVQKKPAEIIYHYHNHEYNGKKTEDDYSSYIFDLPEGCYTKAVYDGDGMLKGYTVGCGYVEGQILSADIVEK